MNYIQVAYDSNKCCVCGSKVVVQKIHSLQPRFPGAIILVPTIDNRCDKHKMTDGDLAHPRNIYNGQEIKVINGQQ